MFSSCLGAAFITSLFPHAIDTSPHHGPMAFGVVGLVSVSGLEFAHI